MPKLQCTFQEAHRAARKTFGEGIRTREWQYEFYLDDKFQFKVTIPDSHGHDTEPISPGTLNSILSQLKLTREEFQGWRRCPLGREEYEAILRERLRL